MTPATTGSKYIGVLNTATRCGPSRLSAMAAATHRARSVATSAASSAPQNASATGASSSTTARSATGSGATPAGHCIPATTTPPICSAAPSANNGSHAMNTVASNRPVKSARLETGRASSASATPACSSRERPSKATNTKPASRIHRTAKPTPGIVKRGAIASL